MERIEEGSVDSNPTTIVCIDGYKFIVITPYSDDGISMIQFFEERDGKSLPAKC